MGGAGIEEESEMDRLKDNLNDSRGERWLRKPENFGKFILYLREPTTGPLPFIEAIENYI